MTDLDFYPPPPYPRRGVLRWIVIFCHAVLFAGAVFTYPSWRHHPAVLESANLIWLAFSVWAGVFAAHLALAFVWDWITGVRQKREYARQSAEYYAERKRHKLRKQFIGALDPTVRETPPPKTQEDL